MPFQPALPPGEPTGHCHAGCYLSGTKNCSEDISKEHYVSKALLEELGEGGLSITGMPWLPKGESQSISISSATAKILCSRHNSSLSVLDTEAARFFRTMRGIADNLSMKSLSRRGKHYLFSGLTLEMWMVKAACGIFFSKIASKGSAKLVADHAFDIDAATKALVNGDFPARGGMYMQGAVGSTVEIADVFQISPLMMADEKRVVGARESFVGHKFDIVFDTQGVVTMTKAQGYIFRPTQIVFTNGVRSHLIEFSWPFYTPREFVELTGSAPSEEIIFDPTKI